MCHLQLASITNDNNGVKPATTINNQPYTVNHSQLERSQAQAGGNAQNDAILTSLVLINRFWFKWRSLWLRNRWLSENKTADAEPPWCVLESPGLIATGWNTEITDSVYFLNKAYLRFKGIQLSSWNYHNLWQLSSLKSGSFRSWSLMFMAVAPWGLEQHWTTNYFDHLVALLLLGSTPQTKWTAKYQE